MNIFKSLFLIFFLIQTGSCYSVDNVQGSKIVIENQTPKSVEFSVVISDELTVKDMKLEHLPITKKWVLVIKREKGNSIDLNSADKKLTLAEFSLLLEESLSFLKSEFPDNHVSQIQTSMNLVNDTWSKVVDIIKTSTKEDGGVVNSKDESILRTVISTITNSNQMLETCRIVSKYDYSCERKIISINPIAFEDWYIGKSWEVIRNIPNAGIKDHMWFGVYLNSK